MSKFFKLFAPEKKDMGFGQGISLEHCGKFKYDAKRFDHEYILEGYFLAADCLASNITKSSLFNAEVENIIFKDEYPSCRLNLLIYPICFTYRHFLEVALKTILFYLGHVEEKDIDKVPINIGHPLRPLWDKVIAEFKTSKTAYEEKTLPFCNEDAEKTREVIDAFDSFDPKGERFRYMNKNKHDNKSHKKTHFKSSDCDENEYIDLNVMRIKMTEIAKLLLTKIKSLSTDITMMDEFPQLWEYHNRED